MRCLTCGVEVAEGRQYCEKCAAFAGGAPQPSASVNTSSDAISKLIPYKNTPALVGYYLSVFSLIPCVGFLLAWVAIALGIWGLIKANADPNAHGKVHAWVAIVLGALVIVGHVGLIVMASLSSR